MITVKYLTNNMTYNKNKQIITPTYVIVHSTACAYHSKDRIFNSWNKPDIEKSCHGMIDHEGSYLTLPLNYRGWHVGKPGNAMSVGFEICEPKNIAFTTAAHNKVDTKKYDPKNADNIADFNARYNNAVEFAAYLCRQTGIPAKNVICHAEAYKMGIGTNHGDVNHWFPLFGKDMDDFRRDVAEKLTLYVKDETQKKEEDKKENTDKIYRVQVGAYKIKKNADQTVKKLKSAGFEAFIRKDNGYYRVQAGAYKNKNNAKNQLLKLKSAGFDAIIKSE